MRFIIAVFLSLILAPACSFAKPVIVVLGDSLTAGYGLPKEDAFPAQLETRLKTWLPTVKVVNMGVSGDTTAGGLHRVPDVMVHKPDAVIIELGANDMLRGILPDVTKENLKQIIAFLHKNEISNILLTGMRAPANYGADYAKQYDAIYPKLAAEMRVLYYPFFLEGVALKPELNLPDGIHPNKQGIAIIADRVTPFAYGLVQK